MPRGPNTVFLDRDGTINVKAPDDEYITRAADVELLPGAGEAVRRLNDAGVDVVVVTNQRGIARGRMSEADHDAVTSALAALLAVQGASWRALYHCPHEKGSCACRKPLPGMIERARADLGVDLAGAVMVGDSASDVEAGRAAGLRTVLLADPAAVGPGAADHVAPSLLRAVDWILAA